MDAKQKAENPRLAISSLGESKEKTVARRFQVLKRFLRHKLAVASAVFIFVVVLVAFPLAPIVAPIHPHKISLGETRQPPGTLHFLGTDYIGRDVWSRMVFGGRVSVSVGLVAVLISVSIGTTLGSVSGYYGGRLDTLVMRITDTFMSFPTLIILIVIVSFIGPGLFNAMVAIGLLGWTGLARLVRGQILSIREMDYITAARASGVPERRIIVRHISPNLVAPITVSASFGVAGAILTEAGLSFLGLGVQMPTPTWGSMLNQAQAIGIIEHEPWLWVPPGLMITLCVLAINFVGDGLRDAFDPRTA